VDLGGRYLAINNFLNQNPALSQTGFVPVSQPAFVVQEWTKQTISARFGLTPTEWWQQQVTVGIDELSQDSRQTERRLTTPADTLMRVVLLTQKKVSVQYNTAFRWTPTTALVATVTAGADHYRWPSNSMFTAGALNTDGTIRLATGHAFSVGRTEVTNTGYFGKLELGVRERLFLTSGVRADDNSTFGREAGTAVSPQVGLAYSHELGTVTLKTRASYGRAIRAPSPGQTFGLVSPTQINLANPRLRPIRQEGWDGGIDVLIGSRGSLGITAYDQDAEDLIVFAQVGTTPLPTFQWQNIGRVTNRGAEVEGTLTLLQRRLQLRGQYGYTDSRIAAVGPTYRGAERVGDRPSGVPTHTAGAALTATPWPRTTLTGGLTYVGSFRQTDFLAQYRCFGQTGPCRPTARDYIVDYPGFTKVNAAIDQRLTAQLSAFISVDNLTNNLALEAYNVGTVQGRLTSVGVQVRY